MSHECKKHDARWDEAFFLDCPLCAGPEITEEWIEETVDSIRSSERVRARELLREFASHCRLVGLFHATNHGK